MKLEYTRTISMEFVRKKVISISTEDSPLEEPMYVDGILMVVIDGRKTLFDYRHDLLNAPRPVNEEIGKLAIKSGIEVSAFWDMVFKTAKEASNEILATIRQKKEDDFGKRLIDLGYG